MKQFKCSIKGCNKKDIEVIYYGYPLCKQDYKKYIDKPNLLKNKLRIKPDNQFKLKIKRLETQKTLK